MLELFLHAYTIHRRVRRASWGGLLLAAPLLWVIFGGIPPHAWFSLVQIIPQLSQLWASKGTSIIIPFGILLIQLLSWGILWGLLFWCWFLAIRYWQEERLERLALLNLRQTDPTPPTVWQRSPDEYIKRELEKKPTEILPALSAHSFLDYSTRLDPGLERRESLNEDSVLAMQGTCTLDGQLVPFGIFAVADGMGGHAHGEDASNMAIGILMESMLASILTCPDTSDASMETLLRYAVQQADQAVREHNQRYATNMGTTLTAALVIEDTAYIGNVGDSRTYLFSKERGLLQITRDHSLVAHLVETGEIKPGDIYTHPERNKIYRCLGDQNPVEIDTFIVDLEPSDRLLLCSDGLWEMVRDPAISSIIQQKGSDSAQASTALLEAALDAGGVDNIGLVVVNYHP